MNIYKYIYCIATPILISSFKYPITRTISLIKPIQIKTFSTKNNDIPKQKSLAPKYKAKTPNQELYTKYLNDPDKSIVLGIGPAGCGKTLFACITALDHLKRGKVDKIVLTRPIVPVEEEEIGFLPGNLVNKMDPWTRPIFDIILEHYQQHELTMMLKNNIIEVSPLAFMRGRTFKNCFIIADEMQNSTPNQMLMLTTRIGTNSKMVITGDLKQSDHKNENNGLRDLMYKLRKPENQEIEEIKMVEMQYEDVERSPIVRKILEIYQNKEPTVPLRSLPNQNKSSLIIENDAALIPKNQLK
jgi:phosphate starvation-inducible PhoH-like protein